MASQLPLQPLTLDAVQAQAISENVRMAPLPMATLDRAGQMKALTVAFARVDVNQSSPQVVDALLALAARTLLMVEVLERSPGQ